MVRAYAAVGAGVPRAGHRDPGPDSPAYVVTPFPVRTSDAMVLWCASATRAHKLAERSLSNGTMGSKLWALLYSQECSFSPAFSLIPLLVFLTAQRLASELARCTCWQISLALISLPTSISSTPLEQPRPWRARPGRRRRWCSTSYRA